MSTPVPASLNKSTTGRLIVTSAVGAALRVLGAVSPETADALTLDLFCRPQKPKRTLEPRAPGLVGHRFTVPFGDENIAVWDWGEGPTVLLVHGWNGCAAQMSRFIEPLVRAGYYVVAPGRRYFAGARARRQAGGAARAAVAAAALRDGIRGLARPLASARLRAAGEHRPGRRWHGQHRPAQPGAIAAGARAGAARSGGPRSAGDGRKGGSRGVAGGDLRSVAWARAHAVVARWGCGEEGGRVRGGGGGADSGQRVGGKGVLVFVRVLVLVWVRALGLGLGVRGFRIRGWSLCASKDQGPSLKRCGSCFSSTRGGWGFRSAFRGSTRSWRRCRESIRRPKEPCCFRRAMDALACGRLTPPLRR